MTKNEFITQYRQTKITLAAFNDSKFLQTGDVDLQEKQYSILEFKNFFCPWYYHNHEEINYKNALDNSQARAMKVCDKSLIDLSCSRKIEIEKRKGSLPHKFWPFPLARDSSTNKTLILDGNKTAIAIYRYWEENNENFNLSVIEIVGLNLAEVIGDFYVVNRA